MINFVPFFVRVDRLRIRLLLKKPLTWTKLQNRTLVLWTLVFRTSHFEVSILNLKWAYLKFQSCLVIDQNSCIRPKFKSHILRPNTSAHPNLTYKVFKQFFKQLFSWQFMMVLLLLSKIVWKNLIKFFNFYSKLQKKVAKIFEQF